MSLPRFFLILGIALGACGKALAAPPGALVLPIQTPRLWYQQPAKTWNDGLMLGNGRLGAVVWGHPAKDRLDLNDDTLYSGEPSQPLNPKGLASLPKIRQLLLAGNYTAAQALVESDLNGKNTECFLPLGSLQLEFSLPAEVSNYKRYLDLSTAVATTTFTHEGVTYTRETFISHPANALVMRFTADQPAKVSFTAKLTTPLKAETSSTDTFLRLKARAPVHASPSYVKPNVTTYDNSPDPKGMRAETRLAATHDGGQLRFTPDSLIAENCTSVTLLLVANTSFNGPYKSPSREGRDESALCDRDLRTLQSTTYDALKAAHISDYRQFFNRVSFTLTPSTASSNKPTDERLKTYTPESDPTLPALYYQFGRYLLISCSRAGTQPSNLQGLWGTLMSPAWAANYTLNCNAQINYWPVEAANLPELHEPLLRLTEELSIDGSRIAKDLYGARGWMAHHNTDLWRVAGPVEGKATWTIFQTGGTWLCQHLWEHYAFSQDRAYLQSVWPVMKGAARFHLDNLMEEPTHHWLVTGPDVNFENPWKAADGTTASVCMGPTGSMQMVRELFENCLRACDILNTDKELRSEIEKALPRLPPMQISPTTGELQEWLDDWQRTAKAQVLSSWGAVCSDQITPRRTPQLAAALRKIFDTNRWWEKGLIGSWEGAFQAMTYARLHDGDTAFAVLSTHLKTSVNTNLSAKFLGHYNYQIDGNLGMTAAIQEMLLQSHVKNPDGTSEIELLPALPKVWPAGTITGLRARGGYLVDITWLNNTLTSATLTATATSAPATLRFGNAVLPLSLPSGKSKSFTPNDFRISP